VSGQIDGAHATLPEQTLEPVLFIESLTNVTIETIHENTSGVGLLAETFTRRAALAAVEPLPRKGTKGAKRFPGKILRAEAMMADLLLIFS
jgi:hypothetical protein